MRKEGRARGQSTDLRAWGGGGGMEHWRSGAAVGLLSVGV